MHLNSTRQHGVSLVESMIALVVISIGLLGIASLQITAMKLNSSALHNSQSVWIAYNMADRVRSNIAQYTNYVGVDTDFAAAQDCLTQACTTAEMINADAADWKALVETLPDGRGMIFQPTGSTNLVITVMWDDEGTGATGTNCGSNPKIDLTCYTVTLVQ